MIPGIGSINISENPVGTTPTKFSSSLILGAPSQWGANSYSHEIRSMGGFWDCKFDILSKGKDIGNLEEYLLNGLGRHVESYSPRGVKVWEGQINRMSLTLPGAQLDVSLDDMMNKVWVRHLTSEGGLIKRSTVFEDTDSQAKYGIKEKVIQGVIIKDTGVADDLAETVLNKYVKAVRPRPTVSPSGTAGGDIRLKVFCSGYIKTLFWRVYNLVTAHTDQNLSIQIQDVITAVAQFVNSSDIVANTQQVSQEYNRDETAFDVIMGLVRLADSSQNRHIAGMYEDRKFKYEQVKGNSFSDVKYNFRIRDNEKKITESGSGVAVPFSEIRPNEYIRIPDIFVGTTRANNIDEDPQVTYIESVTYQEPIGLRILPDAITSLDTLFTLSTYGGSSPL